MSTTLFPTSYLTDAEKDQFATDGFLIVRHALPSHHVADIRESLARDVDPPSRYGAEFQNTILSADGGLLSVTNPLSSCVGLLDAILHQGFFPKIHELLHGTTRLVSNEYFLTPPRSAPRISWHRDAEERNYPTLDLRSSLVSINCLLLLSDVGPANGPTVALPGSHRWGQSKGTPERWRKMSEPSAVPGAVMLCAPSGSAVIFNSRLYHSQSANQSDVARETLVLLFGQRWMRAHEGYVPDPPEARALAVDDLGKQVLGLSPPFDVPCAQFAPRERWHV